MLTTFVLVAALPVFAWQAMAQILELSEGSGSTVITGSGETLHGAGESGQRSAVSDQHTATGSVEIETSSDSTASGSDIAPAENAIDSGVLVLDTSSGSVASGSTIPSDDFATGTGSITPGTSSGSTASGSVSSEATSDPTSSFGLRGASQPILLTSRTAVPVLLIPRTDTINDSAVLRSRMSVTVRSASGISIPVATDLTESGTGFLLTVTPTGAVTPGTATLTVTLKESGLFGFFGATDELFSGDITLGRLIANADQDTYTIGQQASIALSLFSESNDPLCGQDVMSVTADQSGIIQTFSTTDGTITTLPKCRHRKIKTDPDYAFTVPITGSATRTVTIDAGSGRA
ncbi:MAG: hypothetical protein PHZ00_06395, partial [Candidatus Peribacteraceae bacterium]|nr:hypothetical protein [Candidatus Peribacteraceae bacterium]